MNEIKAFAFEDSLVRTVREGEENLWVAKDVCDVLGLTNPTESLRSLDDDELTSVILRAGGQNREMNAVTESGLYALIFKSRKPEAKRFRRWVTHEVLPQIRRTGAYLNTARTEQLRRLLDQYGPQMSKKAYDKAVLMLLGAASGSEGPSRTGEDAMEQVRAFLDDTLTGEPLLIFSAELFRAYLKWCSASHRQKQLANVHAFGQVMGKLGYRSKCARRKNHTGKAYRLERREGK